MTPSLSSLPPAPCLFFLLLLWSCGGANLPPCQSGNDCPPSGPVCDAESQRCRPCRSAEDDRACRVLNPATPFCNPSTGTCAPCQGGGVACLVCKADGDCKDSKLPRCEAATGKCVACLVQNDNCQMGFVCTRSNNTWVCAQGCKTDNDCRFDGGVVGRCCNQARRIQA